MAEIAIFLPNSNICLSYEQPAWARNPTPIIASTSNHLHWWAKHANFGDQKPMMNKKQHPQILDLPSIRLSSNNKTAIIFQTDIS